MQKGRRKQKNDTVKRLSDSQNFITCCGFCSGALFEEGKSGFGHRAVSRISAVCRAFTKVWHLWKERAAYKTSGDSGAKTGRIASCA